MAKTMGGVVGAGKTFLTIGGFSASGGLEGQMLGGAMMGGLFGVLEAAR